MYDDLEYKTSAELCANMAKECDTAILAFSTGKDSIAAWLQMRKYFKRVVPYYCYLVPGLEFVEESLRYYEDFFECHIYRLPHRSLIRWLRNSIFITPRAAGAVAKSEDLPYIEEYDDDIIGELMRYNGNLPDAAYVGTGVRMADSPYRRIGIMTHGAINHNAKRFYPVYDWKKEDLLRAFDESGVRLPLDYRLFGRTFDGLDYRFLKPIKEQFPRDYEKILEWFPFCALEIGRRDGINTIQVRRSDQ